MNAYSFLDVLCNLSGPTGSVNLGAGAANAEEGITFEPNEDIGTMTKGADDATMHSLHGNTSGKAIVRLLKTSPTNAVLSAMYLAQTQTASLYGQNVISLVDPNLGDTIINTQVAFARAPTINYAKLGGIMEWTFNVGSMQRKLGGA